MTTENTTEKPKIVLSKKKPKAVTVKKKLNGGTVLRQVEPLPNKERTVIFSIEKNRDIEVDVKNYKSYLENPEAIDSLIINEIQRYDRNDPEKMKRNHLRKQWSPQIIELRRYRILDLMRKGKTKAQVASEISAYWGSSWCSSYHYVTDAINTLIQLEPTIMIEEVRKIQEIRYSYVAERAMEKENWDVVLKCYDAISKLYGLYSDTFIANTMINQDIRLEFE